MKTKLLFLVVSLLSSVIATPLDDYVSKEEPKYSKTFLDDKTFKA